MFLVNRGHYLARALRQACPAFGLLRSQQQLRILSASDDPLLIRGVACPLLPRSPLFRSSPLSTMATTRTITTSPLPELDSLRIQELRSHDVADLSTAYDMIFRAERHAVQQQAKEDIMTARVAGYLLLEFHAQSDIFGDSSCTSLARSVISPPPNLASDDNEHAAIYRVGKLCRDRFLRLFRKPIIRNGSYSEYLPPPYPEFDTSEDMIKYLVKATGNDYMTLRRKALARDGFQCMVTSFFDQDSCRHCPKLEDIAEHYSIPCFNIQTVHIINESTMQIIDSEGISEDSVVIKIDDDLDAIPILESFGFSNLAKALKQPGGIHQVWNLLSLEHNLYNDFNAFSIWFESAGQPHFYKVCTSRKVIEDHIRCMFRHSRLHIDAVPMVVKFNSQLEEAPPPNPSLLALHATCARVTHMSGATRYFLQKDVDAEEMDDSDSD